MRRRPRRCSYINTLTTQKVRAIAISANDPNAVVPALQKAMSAGIKVVTYDSDTAPQGRNLFINQANSEDLGRSEVQLLGKQLRLQGRHRDPVARRRTPRTRTRGSSS